MQRFVVVGLDHRHIYDLTKGLLDAGLDCAGYWPETSDPRVLKGFQERFPQLPAVADRALLGDVPGVDQVGQVLAQRRLRQPEPVLQDAELDALRRAEHRADTQPLRRVDDLVEGGGPRGHPNSRR